MAQLRPMQDLGDAIDWWKGRSDAQREYAEQSHLMALQYRNKLLSGNNEPDLKHLEKLNWVVGEAKKKHHLEDRYYPRQKLVQPRSKHHIYWLTAIGFMTIALVVLGAISLGLYLAPFSSPLIWIVLRLIMPFLTIGLVMAMAVTAVVHYGKHFS